MTGDASYGDSCLSGYLADDFMMILSIPQSTGACGNDLFRIMLIADLAVLGEAGDESL